MTDEDVREARNELVRAWLRAQRDLRAARMLARASESLPDMAVYHAQQAGEKAVKGLLAHHDHPLEKTHNVEVLVRLAEGYDGAMTAQRSAAKLLTPYATRFRYTEGPLEPSQAELNEALAAAWQIYTFVLSRLPPEVHP